LSTISNIIENRRFISNYPQNDYILSGR